MFPCAMVKKIALDTSINIVPGICKVFYFKNTPRNCNQLNLIKGVRKEKNVKGSCYYVIKMTVRTKLLFLYSHCLMDG